MRVAALVIGLAVSLFFFFQSQDISRLGAFAAAFGSEEAASASEAASVGMAAALMGGIAAGLALKVALLSAIFFFFAGTSALSVGGTYPDAGVWGWVYLALMALSFFAWLGHRRKVKGQSN